MVVVCCGRVIIISALSLSLRVKDKERVEREIELDKKIWFLFSHGPVVVYQNSKETNLLKVCLNLLINFYYLHSTAAQINDFSDIITKQEIQKEGCLNYLMFTFKYNTTNITYLKNKLIVFIIDTLYFELSRSIESLLWSLSTM